MERKEEGIYIEWKPAPGHSILHNDYHAYIVYRDKNGGETVIRGGPEKRGSYIGIFGENIEVQSGVPLDKSLDAYGHEDNPISRHSTKLDLQGKDPKQVFQQMQKQANQIGDGKVDYNLTSKPMQNSNSVVRSVLDDAGIDLPEGLPIENLPGIENNLSNPQDGILWNSHQPETDPRAPGRRLKPSGANNLGPTAKSPNQGAGRTSDPQKIEQGQKVTNDLGSMVSDFFEGAYNRSKSDTPSPNGVPSDWVGGGDTEIPSQSSSEGPAQGGTITEGSGSKNTDESDTKGAGAGAGAGSGADSGGSEGSTQSLAASLRGPDDRQDFLYKGLGQLTEREVRNMIDSDAYHLPQHPDYLETKEKVMAWYDDVYGTGNADIDRFGRIIEPKPVRAIASVVTPARAADHQPLDKAVDDVAGRLGRIAPHDNDENRIRILQEGLNITRPEAVPLKTDGIAGPKTRGTLKSTLVTNGPAGVENGLALAAFKPAVHKAAGGGGAAGLDAAAKSSLGSLFPAKSQTGKSRPDCLGLQMAINDLGANKGVQPIKEDGWIGPKTEAAFGNLARKIGPEDMVSGIGKAFGFFD